MKIADLIRSRQNIKNMTARAIFIGRALDEKPEKNSFNDKGIRKAI